MGCEDGVLFLPKAFNGIPGPHTTLLTILCPCCSFIEPGKELLAFQNLYVHGFSFFKSCGQVGCEDVALFLLKAFNGTLGPHTLC